MYIAPLTVGAAGVVRKARGVAESKASTVSCILGCRGHGRRGGDCRRFRDFAARSFDEMKEWNTAALASSVLYNSFHARGVDIRSAINRGSILVDSICFEKLDSTHTSCCD